VIGLEFVVGFGFLVPGIWLRSLPIVGFLGAAAAVAGLAFLAAGALLFFRRSRLEQQVRYLLAEPSQNGSFVKRDRSG